jgi:hypothetical protein
MTNRLNFGQTNKSKHNDKINEFEEINLGSKRTEIIYK